jgi:hypothetical protein
MTRSKKRAVAAAAIRDGEEDEDSGMSFSIIPFQSINSYSAVDMLGSGSDVDPEHAPEAEGDYEHDEAEDEMMNGEEEDDEQEQDVEEEDEIEGDIPEVFTCFHRFTVTSNCVKTLQEQGQESSAPTPPTSAPPPRLKIKIKLPASTPSASVGTVSRRSPSRGKYAIGG